MAFALKSLVDKKSLAMTRARFHAWWQGGEFDAEAAAAALQQAENANEAAADVEAALFDEPKYQWPPRLAAVSRLWGSHRLRPGDDAADRLEPARLGLDPTARLAVLGAGLAAPLIAVAETHPGPIDVFEWREETIDALRAGLKQGGLTERVSVVRIDLEAHVWQANQFDGLWSVDDFAYCGYPPHLAQQIYKMLKPGGCAVVECYIGLPTPDYATAFASCFAEPQIRAHGDILRFFEDAGLTLDSDDDLTDEFFGYAKAGFKNLGAALADPAGLDVIAARELAWEAEAWRMRLKLIAQRRLERRRFVVRKAVGEIFDAPTDAAPSEAGRDA
jgi:SAM-dependent methyltransferase